MNIRSMIWKEIQNLIQVLFWSSCWLRMRLLSMILLFFQCIDITNKAFKSEWENSCPQGGIKEDLPTACPPFVIIWYFSSSVNLLICKLAGFTFLPFANLPFPKPSDPWQSMQYFSKISFPFVSSKSSTELQLCITDEADTKKITDKNRNPFSFCLSII